MSTFSEYFDGKIFCINVAARKDRREHAQRMFDRLGITPIWFAAHSGVVVDGRVNGNAGCTASHRGILEIVAHEMYPRAFVFEDDADVIYTDFNERFERFIAEVPGDWGLMYLGGGYGEPPIRRVSPHVIQAGRVMTTSSYGITWQQARKMAPYVSGVGPIDSIFQGFNREAPTYVMTPRAVVQLPGYSDLQEREMDNSQSMLDRALERDLA